MLDGWGTHEHEKAFHDFKLMLMQLFNESNPFLLSDDNIWEMGVDLLQENAPIRYSSKTLMETQKSVLLFWKDMLVIALGAKIPLIFARKEIHSGDRP